MSAPFDYFIVFAEMRTGSNFLETNLNAFDGIECHGEAFNPHFIGYPNKTEILNITQQMREADPIRLVQEIKTKSNGLGGFRFFHNHDPRILDAALKDPRCAKIILTRNPIESYVSWKIAQVTGQWKLTNVKARRASKIKFDGSEFEEHISKLREFQVFLLGQLQELGQTAFYLAYEDLQSVEAINGLAQFLGVDSRLEQLDGSLKKQNPSPLEDKVSNFDELQRALASVDPFNLTQPPCFEPRRGAGVPGFVTGAHASLLYMPVRGGPELEVKDWMASLDGVSPEKLPTKYNQKSLRQWKRRKKGHRSFTVLRHPVARIHAVFCDKILGNHPGAFSEIRKTLRQMYNVNVPDADFEAQYDRRAHRTAFLAFLEFLRANLLNQTSIRVDTHWATQSAVLQGMAGFSLPDLVIREEEMQLYLPMLARQVGYTEPKLPKQTRDSARIPLTDIYDGEIEKKVADVYQRDYMMFGFKTWA